VRGALGRTRAAALAGAAASRWSTIASVWNGVSRSIPAIFSRTSAPSVWTCGGHPTASRTSPPAAPPP